VKKVPDSGVKYSPAKVEMLVEVTANILYLKPSRGTCKKIKYIL